jgi:membrane protease YdiL (CAAX protease family)
MTMSTISTTYLVSDFESRSPSTGEATARSWGFWATFGWFVLALAAAAIGLIPLGLAYGAWSRASGLVLGEQILEMLGIAAFTIAIASVLALAARRAGASAAHYLGLLWPQWRYIAIGFALLAVEVVFNIGLFSLLPTTDESRPSIVDDYRSLIGNPGGLLLFWLALVVIAPVTEEIVFRGFILRGWLDTRLGVAGSIVLVSLLFAAVHVPDELPVFISLFFGGLLLGTMRWLSGSIVLWACDVRGAPARLLGSWRVQCGTGAVPPALRPTPWSRRIA